MTATSTHVDASNIKSSADSRARGILSSPRDRRTLVWSFGLFPLPTLVVLYAPNWWLVALPIALYLGFCAGVLAHYHNHRPVFRSRFSNAVYSNYLGIFYGFPLFGWIPTHNQNHHKFVNGPGDATRTTKMGKDSLLHAILYPLRSSSWQLPALRRHIEKGRKKNGYRSVEPLVQTATLVAAHVIIATLAVARSGARVGGLTYFALVLSPALFSSWAMMFTNYLQHVGCEPKSPDNHSRNFVGGWENWLVFDAGLHTVHHEHPGVHFSEYRRLHEARVHRINPELNERNMLTFLVKRYVLGRSRAAGRAARKS